MKRPSPDARHDAPTMTEWFALLRGVMPSQANAALRDARALADSWACPVCGEHGAHRCDK